MFFFFNTKLSENKSEDLGVNRGASLCSAFKGAEVWSGTSRSYVRPPDF